MSSAVLSMVGVVVSALIALAGVIYVQRSTRGLRDADRDAEHDAAVKRLESEAYGRARESYEAAISRYQGDLKALEGRVLAAEQRVQHAEERAIKAEERAVRAEAVSRRLVRELTHHNIPVPPEISVLGEVRRSDDPR